MAVFCLCLGANFDSNAPMVAHLKRQFHRLLWKAEKKKPQMPQGQHEDFLKF